MPAKKKIEQENLPKPNKLEPTKPKRVCKPRKKTTQPDTKDQEEKTFKYDSSNAMTSISIQENKSPSKPKKGNEEETKAKSSKTASDKAKKASPAEAKKTSKEIPTEKDKSSVSTKSTRRKSDAVEVSTSKKENRGKTTAKAKEERIATKEETKIDEEQVVKITKPSAKKKLSEAERKKYEQQLEEEKAAEEAKKTTPQKPKVRYSDEELEVFRKRILEVKKEALEELNMLRERLEDLNAYDLAEEGSIYSMHMAEQGSEIFEKEKVYAQIQRINEYIKKLDEALKRIDDKTYGICRVCGILIAKERLLAVPITTLSASYKIHKKCPEDGIDRIEPVIK